MSEMKARRSTRNGRVESKRRVSNRKASKNLETRSITTRIVLVSRVLGLRRMRPLTATTPRRGSVRTQLLGPKNRPTIGPFSEVHLAKRLRNTKLIHSAHAPAERPTCLGASWPAHWEKPIRPGRRDPTRRALHERDVTQSLFHNGIGDVLPCTTPKPQDVHFPTITTTGISRAYKYPMGTQVLPPPPPVSLEVQRLDSLQQPTLRANWAYMVLFSPRNNIHV
ncbi:hypothetical protein PIB30_017011 [Stylosanthes scabra]|uniref:Uncharacterized protein n=1 Tax=Stylosanthes scabra TaxID=79078 RepID=A0ABU6Q825_9FABA|nr:hypothetical protein [Stylosanthes scabra]